MTVPGNIPAPMMAAKAPLEIKGTSIGSTDANEASHIVTLPSGILAGETILVIFSTDGITGVTWGGTDFTEFFQVSNSTANTLAFAWKKAVGSETSITVTTTSNQSTSYTAYRIAGAKDPAVRAPETSTGATGSSSNPDPDLITPTGGSKDYLFIATHGHDTSKTTTGFPTDYSNGISAESASGAGDCGVASAERLLTASSENPGTFTISGSDTWVAATIVVHPA